MAIEEAISHAREVADARTDMCDECREEHRQLEELKTLRKLKESVLKDYEDDIANANQNIKSMKYEMYLAEHLNR